MLKALNFKLGYVEGLMNFSPRPDDIYIASYPRSGTTWLQMILYTLTTGGDVTFGHISEVVPYFERALISGRDLNTLPSPRVFKTHWAYRRKPHFQWPGRFIYITRDGRDVLLSCYHFFRSHSWQPADFDGFFRSFVNGTLRIGSWFSHVSEWRAHGNDSNILLLTYEDLQDDLEESLRRIALFCGLELSPERLALIKCRCSFTYMKQFEDKFDDTHEILWQMGYIPKQFLRDGRSGGWKEVFTDEQKVRFDRAAKSWHLADQEPNRYQQTQHVGRNY